MQEEKDGGKTESINLAPPFAHIHLNTDAHLNNASPHLNTCTHTYLNISTHTYT